MQKNYDIAVVGGGLAGLTLSILLGQQGWQVVCIDRQPLAAQTEKTYDIRTTAISWGSKNLLAHAGVWKAMADKAEPIKQIVIKDDDSPITLNFDSASIDAEAFGWIVDNYDLRLELLGVIEGLETVTHITGQAVQQFDNLTDTISIKMENDDFLQARLVIGADGRNSMTREAMGIGTWEKDYKQSAIVCLINHTKPHEGRALEHFLSHGPFAILPFTDTTSNKYRSAVIWTVSTKDANGWVNCDKDIFNAALQERCGDMYGTIDVAGERASWPLNLKKAYGYTSHRMALVAEAAHGIHPIAGQGLNMSLRDIAAIIEILEGATDPGAAELLTRYQKMRMKDNLGMAVATDGLNTLFGIDVAPVRAARRAGLHVVSKLPFAQKFFMKQAMGAVGNLPKLIKNEAA